MCGLDSVGGLRFISSQYSKGPPESSLRLLFLWFCYSRAPCVKGNILSWVAWWSLTGSRSTPAEHESSLHTTQPHCITCSGALVSWSGSVALFTSRFNMREQCSSTLLFIVWAAKLLLWPLYKLNLNMPAYVYLSRKKQYTYRAKFCVAPCNCMPHPWGDLGSSLRGQMETTI